MAKNMRNGYTTCEEYHGLSFLDLPKKWNLLDIDSFRIVYILNAQSNASSLCRYISPCLLRVQQDSQADENKVTHE